MDPQVVKVLAAMAQTSSPSLEASTPAQMREMYGHISEQLGGASYPMASVTDLSVPGPAGSIAIRAYRPQGLGNEAQPALIYVHGGGWVLGSIDTHDKVSRRLAQTCGCIVIAIDYRLAPEHPFPAGPEDVIAASRWVLDNARTLGLDEHRIGIAGDSAGGNLSAVTAVANRGRHGPALCCQVLIYPSTDNSPGSEQRPSRVAQAQTPPLTANGMRMMHSSYLPDPADASDWRASPLLAEKLRGLPPALVISGGFDPLLDENVAYVQRLVESGVEVLHQHYPGQVHGFIEMGGALDAVEDAMQTIAFWFARCSVQK
jgi:acetyl esterase